LNDTGPHKMGKDPTLRCRVRVKKDFFDFLIDRFPSFCTFNYNVQKSEILHSFWFSTTTRPRSGSRHGDRVGHCSIRLM